MKLLSLETQKRTLFIPFVNYFNIIVWPYHAYCMKIPGALSKTGWIFLSTFVPICAVYYVCCSVTPEFALAIRCVGAYVLPVLIGYRLIRFQEGSSHRRPSYYRYSMFSSKKYIILIIVSILLVVIPVCVILFSGTALEDTNGADDYSLAILTREEVISTTADYSAKVVQTSHSGNQTNVEQRMKEYDYDKCSMSCREINGISTLQVTRTSNSSITLNISSTIESGNMEIFVLVDGVLHCTISAGCRQTVTLADIAGKEVSVRLAAESARVSVTVVRSFG